MKYHIAFKFLAVLLCAMTLFSSIVAVTGIAVTELEDLYSQNVPATILESKLQILSGAARNVAGQYLSEVIGGCPASLVNEYYYTYLQDSDLKSGTWGFELRDPNDTVLYCDYPDHRESLDSHTFTMPLHYLVLVEPPVPADDAYIPPYGRQSSMISPTEAPSEDGSDTDSLTKDAYGMIYWDDARGCYLDVKVRSEYASGYSITLWFSEESFADRDTWSLIAFLWQNRYALFWMLGISLLLFAMSAVYLCCAAGRKPGSEEIRAGGFNALPLDLYLGIIALLLLLDYRIADELVNWASLSFTGLVFVGICAALVPSLLFVAFCFACAAQIKEGNGRWWRKSGLGLSVIALYRLTFQALTAWIPAGMLWLWKGFKALIRLLLQLLRVIWDTFGGAVKWVWGKITGAFWWVGGKVERSFSLLPLTWQWILIGCALVAILFLGIVHAMDYHRSGMGLLIAVGLCLFVVLYGAHAFGILLEGVKRMGKGDLDSKVSDRLLLGAFREFAGDLNALAEVVREAAQKEMRSERMKTELITNVSHDIKTPLTSIINYVDLLQKPHTPEEETQYLEVLGRKAEQLKKLIQDLMEMSKASTGNMAVHPEQVDAGETVTQALGEFADKLAQRQLTVVFTPPQDKIRMKADGRLAWRVLSNLLSNAVKYAMPGTRLYVGLEQTRDRVLISLKNISAEPLNIDAGELMERFVRGDASRNSEGSGLGLNIAKSLMEVQGGTLELTVDGDLFKVTLSFPKG